MSPISFVFFDLGNVICTFSHDLAAKQMADVCGLEPSIVKQHVFESDLQAKYEKGLITTEQFHAEFCERTGCTVEINELMKAGSDIFRMNLGIAPLITQMRAAGFPMTILSNTCSAHWDFITRRFPILRDWFDGEPLLSFEVQMAKPELAIYQLAIQRAGVEPESIFFTDDRLENVHGAKQAGIQAVPFENPFQLYRELSLRGVDINL